MPNPRFAKGLEACAAILLKGLTAFWYYCLIRIFVSCVMNDLFQLNNKSALVTGGSRGIGEMIATGFVSNGVKTYISSRKADACDATAERLSERGECISIPCDLSSMEGVRYLADRIAEREESLDILVNNAGATWGEPLESFSGRWLGQDHGDQSQGAVFSGAGIIAVTGKSSESRGSGADYQHRFDRRLACEQAANVFIWAEQSRYSSADKDACRKSGE